MSAQLRAVLREEHKELKDWMSTMLEKQNSLLEKNLLDQLQPVSQQDSACVSTRPSRTDRTDNRLKPVPVHTMQSGDLRPRKLSRVRTMTKPADEEAPIPEGVPSFLIPPRPGGHFLVTAHGDVPDVPLRGPDLTPIVPLPSFSCSVPNTPAAPARNRSKARLITFPPNSDLANGDLASVVSVASSTLPQAVPMESEAEAEGSHANPPTPSGGIRQSSTEKLTDPSEESTPDQSDQDRAEWKQHLERRVTEQLSTKNFRRKTVSRANLGQITQPEEPSRAGRALNVLRRMVDSNPFQWTSATIIIINVGYIGYTTDVAMGNVLSTPPVPDPDAFKAIDKAFLVFYLVELCLRVLAYRAEWLTGPDAKWNAFDAGLVMVSLAEQVVQDVSMGVGSLRVMRGVRMFRVLRIIRVMRYFRDLRLMVCSIMQSLGSLSWALLLLLIIMYLFSIVFMQGAILHLQGKHEDNELPEPVIIDGVVQWYNSVINTMYTLLASIVNGVGWVDVAKPLESISMVYRWLFSFYVVFVVIGVLNVLTGIFVERACELSGLDKDLVIQTQLKRNETFLVEMKRIFEEADADESGTISWEEFKGYLENDRVQAYLSTQQLDAFDARQLFDILNGETDNEMSIESFIVGCQRLRGMARSVDVVSVLQETRAMHRKLKFLMRRLDCGQHLTRTAEMKRSPTLASAASLEIP
mmetsp:Transcript_81182/g.250550  ORF Transcript_81182/g.250550 Transcript_81182/m.250550 type:complete len:695 (+) Transcript_81182:236-2320(+)